ncbi:MAG: hypothetical protein RL216_2130 [Pseudomonadota bacterium]
MPEDTVKPDDTRAQPLSGDPEIAELRRAALLFARKLGSYGLARVEDIGEELEAGSDTLVQEGRRLAHDLRERVAKLESRVEHSVRDHPAQAIAALLGVVGFGLILGLILRRRD